MPNQVVGDTVRVTLVGSLFDQVIMNVFDYKVTLSGGQPIGVVANALDAAFDVANGFYDKYRAICPRSYVHDFTWIQTIRPNRYVKSIFSIGSNGTNAADTTVTNVALTITKRSDIANRRGTGSVHIPVSPDSAGLDAGRIGGAIKAAATAFGTLMSSDQSILTASTNLSPCISNAAGTFPSVPYTNFIVQLTSRVVRRRTVGLGI